MFKELESHLKKVEKMLKVFLKKYEKRKRKIYKKECVKEEGKGNYV